MSNFDFRRSSRKCSKSDRVIQPGEEFYSALIDTAGETERLDFCCEAWESPPENCIGWWKSKVPELGKGKVYWAPRDVLLSYFEHLQEQPDQADTTYVMALLLIQKKILTLEDPDEEHANLLQLKNRQEKSSSTVEIVDVTPERIGEIQAELEERLFSDQPFESDDDDEDVEV